MDEAQTRRPVKRVASEVRQGDLITRAGKRYVVRGSVRTSMASWAITYYRDVPDADPSQFETWVGKPDAIFGSSQ